MFLPTVIFGIEISKKYFGKKPKSPDNSLLGLSPFLQMKIACGEVELENFYGEGSFKPYDIVQLQSFSGDDTLFDNLYKLTKTESQKCKCGDKFLTEDGTIGKIFGYEIPSNWEEVGIRIVDDSDNKFTFIKRDDKQVVSKVEFPLIGIIQPNLQIV